MSSKKPAQAVEEFDSFFFKVRVWYMNYKRFVFLLIPFFLLALTVIFKNSLSSSRSGQEALKVKHAYHEWEKANDADSIHWKTLATFLKKRPDLLIPYEAKIVQRLLAVGKYEEIGPIAQHVIKRAVNHGHPYYTEFAKTTLEIEKNNEFTTLRKALDASLALKETMLADGQFWEGQKSPTFGSMLFAFNLLRVALLSQVLDLKQEELVAWREFKRYASWNSQSSEAYIDRAAFQRLANHFSQGGVSLQDYIKHREETILAEKV